MQTIATAVILFDQIDNDLLPDCLLSLPKWCKPLIFNAKEGSEERIKEIRNDEHLQLYEYTYTGVLNFAKARNLAKFYAETSWIISIDADERLDYNQHKYIYQLLTEADDDIGGFMVTQWSFCSFIRDTEHPERNLRLAVPTVRIFRNLPPFTWRFEIHEVIEPSIIESGYTILDTKINFLHEGYALSKERMKQKLERNIRTILNYPHLYETKRYKEYLINSCVMLKHLGGI
ncbi:MAG: hypothetical protein N2560_08755 [Ignavibacteria bacterium]|nr:hypothetical protein [Ignavibacteria bacterium]